ncbi:MAG: cysteine desulfurase-like protein [Candidatus Limnocylindrales bacterium]
MTDQLDRARGGARRSTAQGGVPVPPDRPVSDLGPVRSHFPALTRDHDGRPFVYLDGPGGTQVPSEAIKHLTAYLERSNANTHGAYATSQETDAVLDAAHSGAADFLGARDSGEVFFGPNMTSLTFAVSRAIGRTMRPGDEIVLTHLDHDANVAPWLALQEERGATIRWVDVCLEDCTLDLASLERAIGRRTRLVAVGLASNAVGTINPIPRIVELAHAAGAWTYVDAVHAAPHLPIDVAALETDFLACSPYKFFGPHLGLVYGKAEHLERLASYKVRPAGDDAPDKWETGTQLHENLAGLVGTFEYLAWLGTALGGAAAEATRHDRLRAAMLAIRSAERALTPRLIDGLAAIPGLRIRGITDPARVDERCPTVAFTLEGHTPRAVSEHLGRRGIATWDGDYYAYELIRTLGLAGSGGMVRVGLAHYNTAEEIDRLVEAVAELVA